LSSTASRRCILRFRGRRAIAPAPRRAPNKQLCLLDVQSRRGCCRRACLLPRCCCVSHLPLLLQLARQPITFRAIGSRRRCHTPTSNLMQAVCSLFPQALSSPPWMKCCCEGALLCFTYALIRQSVLHSICGRYPERELSRGFAPLRSRSISLLLVN
jgi:hypothetical protein